MGIMYREQKVRDECKEHRIWGIDVKREEYCIMD